MKNLILDNKKHKIDEIFHELGSVLGVFRTILVSGHPVSRSKNVFEDCLRDEPK
jgi:hypothetical protein